MENTNIQYQAHYKISHLILEHAYRVLVMTIKMNYMLSLLTFGLWGYFFYVTPGYYINLFSYNALFVRRVVC